MNANKKVVFLIREFWLLSWSASVQRAKLYKHDTDENDRANFKHDVIEYCEKQLLPHYLSPISEADHEHKIEELVKYASASKYSFVLKNNYRVGIAQKLFNLQLKYLWVSGLLKNEPPQCPIDRIMLSKTHLAGSINWTQIDSITEYQMVIQAMKEIAGKKSLAVWELDEFNRR